MMENITLTKEQYTNCKKVLEGSNRFYLYFDWDSEMERDRVVKRFPYDVNLIYNKKKIRGEVLRITVLHKKILDKEERKKYKSFVHCIMIKPNDKEDFGFAKKEVYVPPTPESKYTREELRAKGFNDVRKIAIEEGIELKRGVNKVELIQRILKKTIIKKKEEPKEEEADEEEADEEIKAEDKAEDELIIEKTKEEKIVIDYESMTKKELIAELKKAKIDYTKSWKKAKLLALLKK